MIVSGIYHGAFTIKDKNIRLPDGTIIKDVAEFVNDPDPEYTFLVDMIFAYIQPPHTLPDEGGYLQQNPLFLDAVDAFKQAKHYFMAEKERIATAWQKLRNKNGKRS